MKKSIKVLVVAAILCCILAVCLTACNNPDKNNGTGSNGSGNESNNSGNAINEIEEFRSIMSNVLDKFNTKEEAQLLSKMSTAKVFEYASEREIYKFMESAEKEVYEKDEILDMVALSNFIAMFSYGEVLSQVSGTDKIYDIPMKVDMGEDIFPHTGYVIVKSKGTHRIAYLYASSEKYGEIVYMYDIDYISAENFSARMLLLTMDTIEIKNERSESISYYIYGDTDNRAIFMKGEWSEEASYGAMAYRDIASGISYITSSEKSVDSCFAKIKSHYEGIDMELLRTLKDNVKYDIAYEQYNKVADELLEKYDVQMHLN